jgi:hypothetical protein
LETDTADTQADEIESVLIENDLVETSSYLWRTREDSSANPCFSGDAVKALQEVETSRSGVSFELH